jgi:hypothetical protein
MKGIRDTVANTLLFSNLANAYCWSDKAIFHVLCAILDIAEEKE